MTREGLALLARFVTNRSIIIGAQSGSARVLENARRGHGVEEVEQAVATALAGGFEPHVDFILGLPGEDGEDVELTLRQMERLAARGAKVHAHSFMPLPGTPFRGERPGVVEDATKRRLDRLASLGTLYGQWKTQARFAREMADSRGRV